MNFHEYLLCEHSSFNIALKSMRFLRHVYECYIKGSVSQFFYIGLKPVFQSQWNIGLKPIFHCDAKLLASGLGVGGNTKIYQHVGIFWRYP